MRTVGIAGGALVLGLLVTGCGSGGAAPPTPWPDPDTAREPATSAAVGERTTGPGRILVDGYGRTLYVFEGDVSGRSACTGVCVRPFPPLLTGGNATPGRGVRAGLLGTAVRPDGTTQVTYQGRPLYRFAGDRVPGDVKGEGIDAFGAEWFVVDVADRRDAPAALASHVRDQEARRAEAARARGQHAHRVPGDPARVSGRRAGRPRPRAAGRGTGIPGPAAPARPGGP